MNVLYLSVTAIIAIFFVYFKFNKKTLESNIFWKFFSSFAEIWLLVTTIFNLLIAINPILVSTEEAKSDINGHIILKHRIIDILDVYNDNHLFHAMKKDYTFSARNLFLSSRKPENEEQSKKLEYNVIYVHRKFF